MRALPLAFTCVLTAFGCGGADASQAPKATRLCGDLVGIEPVKPTALAEDEHGCPIFEPIPCTQSRAEYSSFCGSDCEPATAIRSDGDEWLVGCVGGLPLPAGCADLEPDPPPLCLVDPEGGEVWRLEIACNAANALFASERCWGPCDARTEEALRDFCP